MKNAIVALVLFTLPCALAGCGGTDSPGKDPPKFYDAASTSKDVLAEDTAKHDTADVATVPTPDSPTVPDAGVDISPPGAQDTPADETKRAADVALDGLDGAPKPGIDGAKPVALDGAPDIGTAAVDGASQVQVTLRSGGAYANCMPMVSADPIIVTWTADVTGARGTTAQLTKATVTVTGPSTIVQEFTVDNPTITLSNGAGSADQRKPLNQQQPNSACDSLCSGGVTYRLDLLYAIDGKSIAVSRSGNFSCAY